MALQLIKLFVAATTTTEVAPDVARFFYITTAETAEGATLTIDAASFFARRRQPSDTAASIGN